MSARIVTGVDQDRRGRITALFGDADAGWSPISTREAVASIRSGQHTYVSVGRRGSADVNIFSSEWLRSTPDLTVEDNLDNLGAPDFSRYGAGAFGIALTLSQDGVGALARELHASGAIVDRVYLLHGPLQVTALLGAPRFEQGAEATQFEIVRDAVCHVRRGDDAADPGTHVVATVTAACVVTVKTDTKAGCGGLHADLLGAYTRGSACADGGVRICTRGSDRGALGLGSRLT